MGWTRRQTIVRCSLALGFFLASAGAFLSAQPAGDLIDGVPVNKEIKPEDVVHWSAVAADAADDGTVVAHLRLVTEQGFAVYVEKLKFGSNTALPAESYQGPTPRTLVHEVTKTAVQVFDAGDFDVRFRGLEAFQGAQFPVSVTFTACASGICLLPYTATLSAPVQRTATIQPAPASTANASSGSMEEGWAERLQRGEFGLVMLIFVAFVGGLMTNLTPCVYPMIPITIRLLMRQGKNPTINASMYSAGIVATYTSLGVLAVMSGQMFGGLLASTGFNVTFAVVMALLGTTMLGFGDFSKLQAAGSKLGSGRASYLNTFLMGAGAGLVASPCTGPILATLLAYSATTLGVAKGSFLIFIYSLGFALPYVFLGRAAARISQVKVSPLIQVAVKLVFAAIMFALAFYYLRIPARALMTAMAPHWQVLALGGVAVGVVLVLVWLTMESLSRNKLSTILPALVLGFGVFALSQWLTAPPGASAQASSVWYKTQEEAFAAARNEGKPIFVDSWAEWCVACKEMEVTTFVDPRVAEEFNSNWVLLKIDMTEDGPETDAMMKKYDVQSLPTFTLVGKGGNLARMESIRGAVGADGLLTKLREFRGKE